MFFRVVVFLCGVTSGFFKEAEGTDTTCAVTVPRAFSTEGRAATVPHTLAGLFSVWAMVCSAGFVCVCGLWQLWSSKSVDYALSSLLLYLYAT